MTRRTRGLSRTQPSGRARRPRPSDTPALAGSTVGSGWQNLSLPELRLSLDCSADRGASDRRTATIECHGHSGITGMMPVVRANLNSEPALSKLGLLTHWVASESMNFKLKKVVRTVATTGAGGHGTVATTGAVGHGGRP